MPARSGDEKAALASRPGMLFGAAASRATVPLAAGLPTGIDAEINFPFVLAVFLLLVVLPAPAPMGSEAALAGNFAMLLRVHGGEAATAVLVSGLAVAMGHPGMAIRLLVIALAVISGRLTVMVGGGFVMEGGVSMKGSPTALPADLGHVTAVTAHRLAAAPSCFGSLLRVELVGRAAPMGRAPAFAGDFALLLRVHGGKPALAPFGH